MQVKRKFNYMNLLLILVFVVGLGILLYPNISNFFNERNSSKATADYDEAVAKMNKKERKAMISKATKYNETLLKDPIGRFDDFTAEQLARYMSLLNVDGNGMMCYLKIKKLGVNLPVYHSTKEDILQKYVGHVEGSSLPVGGLGTHCALSGHRGLPSAVLFTNLDRMEVGDTFAIEVLGEEHTYVVDQIKIVLPDDLTPLEIDPNKDYVTLITCTPYGVNTHRLMVRGVRVPDKDVAAVVKEGSKGDKKFLNFTREQIVNMVAAGMTAMFGLILIPILLFPAVRKEEFPLRPWDDNLEEVYKAAIAVSEQSTRANWEVEDISEKADKLANQRRWDDTQNNKDPISENDELRKWHDYEYEDEEGISQEEKDNYREWDDEILKKVDQDWEPITRNRDAFKKVVKYQNIDEVVKKGDVKDVEPDLKPYYEKEIEAGKVLVEKSKKKP